MQYLKEEEGMKLRKKSWIYIRGNVVVEWVSSCVKVYTGLMYCMLLICSY